MIRTFLCNDDSQLISFGDSMLFTVNRNIKIVSYFNKLPEVRK